MALTAATDYLQMTELKEFCLAEIETTLKPTNVLPLWKEANTLGLIEVARHCEKMMASRIAVISTQADFLALNCDQIRLYVRYICDDCAQADDVFEAVMRWVSHDTNNRLSFLEDILRHMDVRKCSAECMKMVKRTYASTMKKLSKAKGLRELLSVQSLIGKKPLLLTHDLCVIGSERLNSSEINPVMWKLNKSNQFEQLCTTNYESCPRRLSVCKTPEGFVITGGTGCSRCMMYISVKQLWKRMPDLPKNLNGHGSICVKQTIYVLGGTTQRETGGAFFQNLDTYMISPCNSKWQSGLKLPFYAMTPKVAEIDNSVYLLDEESTRLVQLDVDSRRWIKRASLPWGGTWNEDQFYRYPGVSMTSAKGQLYVAGGRRKVFAYYRPCIDTWCFATPPLRKHIYGSLVCHEDKLILLGGKYCNGSDDVEEYSFEEGTWSLCSYKMPSGLFNHCGLVLDASRTDSEHADNCCSVS